MFTLYRSDIIGNSSNCRYPHAVVVNNAEDLRAAVCKDYVCAKYNNNYRQTDNFIGTDCLPLDCDNDHSEDDIDWVTPEDIRQTFPDVMFAVHYSRNHMKEKGGRSARPKFHVLFPIRYITDAEQYKAMKARINEIFPYFDTNALDASRFYFGTADPNVEIFEGSITISDYLEEKDLEAFEKKVEDMMHWDPVIEEGSRNSTLSKKAAVLLKKYGDTPDTYERYLKEVDKCDPPLDEHEIKTIWYSAMKWYRRISKDPSYVPPEVYNDTASYEPDEYTDVGQATAVAEHFASALRYSTATKFIHFNGVYWEENQPSAQAVVHELTRRQLKEARARLGETMEAMKEVGAVEIAINKTERAARSVMNTKQLEVFENYLLAKKYLDFALKRQDSKYITNTLHEVQPMLQIKVSDLDTDEFALCTPAATYDLRMGLAGAREHDPEDFITQVTKVSPGKAGRAMWDDCLQTIFCGDQELIDYVQLVCGMAAVGRVRQEALIIAYGDGRNGKSTFWNTIAAVLGTYSGKISADVLTTASAYKNVKPELAELRGKRLVIASELQGGTRLNDSTLKQLCSTDPIRAEKKFKDPFDFIPSHSLVLYTNHLPKVSEVDEGTWRRLIVVPFKAHITGGDDKKNYGDELVTKAGESILAWVVEGAQKAIELDYKIPLPASVEEASAAYRDSNDWFKSFIEDRCNVGEMRECRSRELYEAYRQHCGESGEYCRSTTEFYSMIDKQGFTRFNRKRIRMIKGLDVKPDNGFDEEIENDDDF